MKAKRIEECGCCEVGVPSTPELIKNRPGLSKISYRVGTYASFRQAMIETIAKSPELNEWKARQSDDYGIALLEMWAYIADILTFYQERIANEFFLRTALYRDTIIRLAAMLDYKLNPGVAASTYLVFFTEKDTKVSIPVGLKVQSLPGQDEKPQKFETIEAIDALSDLNEMKLQSITEEQFVLRRQKELVLKGINTGLEVGDYILIIGKHHKDNPGSERWDIRKLNSVKVDSETKTTTVGWDEGLGHRRVDFPTKEENEDLQIYAMRLIAWPFGANAPDWRLSPRKLENINKQKQKNINKKKLQDIYKQKPEDISIPIYLDWTDKTLPEDDENPNHIFLDNIYETIDADTWIVLLTAEPPSQEPQYPGYSEVYYVESVDNTVISNYTLTSKVTRLTVGGIEKRKRKDTQKRIWPEHIDYFPMQGTMVLAQSEPLEKAEILIETPLTGAKLVFERYYPDLRRGQKLIVKGNKSKSSDEEAIEVVEIETVKLNEKFRNTTVDLKKGLQNSYKRKTVSVCGNVAKATHGETISSEVIGNGDASIEFQSFSLKKSQTTFVPAPLAPRGAKNTLEVRVGDVLWEEVESLYGQNPNSQAYTTQIDNEGKMNIQFGDGLTGARLSTGRNNVIGKYRQGLGSEGNVIADSLITLLDRPVGLKSSINPIQAEGGTDPESLEEARNNAPNTVRTFERAISLGDYEDIARNYTGIAKVKAVLMLKHEDEVVQLTIAGEKGSRIEKTSQTYENFISYLNLHRDINHIVDVIPHSKRPLVLKTTIKVDLYYLKEKVLKEVRTSILEYFKFENLQLGQGIHLSNIYATMQSVEGVNAVRVEYFDYKKNEDIPPSLSLFSHIRIKPDQIASLEDFDLEIVTDFAQKE